MSEENTFTHILQYSDQEEKRRMGRSLYEIMKDEYQLNHRMNKLIEADSYVFPSFHEDQAAPDTLIRTQDTISAKKHHYSTKPYFHRHDFIEMIYVYKGLCHQYIDTRDQLMILQEGDLFILNQNVSHALYQPHPDDIIIKMIIPTVYLGREFIESQKHYFPILDFLRNSVVEGGSSYHYLLFRTMSHPLVRQLVENMVIEFYQRKLHFEDAMCSYLKLLWIELSRHDFIISNVIAEGKTGRLDYEKLVSLIRANLPTITLDHLADEFSYNKCYLSRLISEEFGKSFQEIVRGIRMEKIETFIRYSNLSIEQIAERVGYKNAAIIYKIIREQYNMTPTEYRKNQN